MSFGEGNLRTAVAELTAENDELRALLADAVGVIVHCCRVETWRTEDSCDRCAHYKGGCCAKFDIATDAAALGVRR